MEDDDGLQDEVKKPTLCLFSSAHSFFQIVKRTMKTFIHAFDGFYTNDV